jgi:uncharacterized membrane protein
MNWRNGVRALAAFWAFVGACFIICGTIIFLGARGYPTASALLALAVVSVAIFLVVSTST